MKSPNEKPDANEFGQLRSYLAQAGFSQAWIAANTDKDNTRQQNIEQLKEALR